MCGIFGYATTTPIPRLWQITMHLALLNESRGKDSWGVTDGVNIIKDSGPISKELYKIPFGKRGTMIGHTRASTVGASTKANAHPFQFEHDGHKIIGVHNGGVANHAEMNKKYGRTSEVDSMHMFQHIIEGRDMGDLQAGGAIVYVLDGKLMFCRFNGGSLTIAKVKDHGLIWSSDDNHLRVALQGGGVEYKLYNPKDQYEYYWGDNELYEIDHKMGIGPRPSNKPVTEYANRHHHQPYHNGYGYSSGLADMKIRIRVVLDQTEPTPTEPVVEEKVIEATPIVAAATPAEAPRYYHPSVDDGWWIDSRREMYDQIRVDILAGKGKYEEIRTLADKQSPCGVCEKGTHRVLMGKPLCPNCLAVGIMKGEINVSEKGVEV